MKYGRGKQISKSNQIDRRDGDSLLVLSAQSKTSPAAVVGPSMLRLCADGAIALRVGVARTAPPLGAFKHLVKAEVSRKLMSSSVRPMSALVDLKSALRTTACRYLRQANIRMPVHSLLLPLDHGQAAEIGGLGRHQRMQSSIR